MKKGIKYIMFLTLLCFTLTVNAQTEKSIDFNDVSFNEIKKLAKQTGKLIFIDCYTTWCMPCKKMDKTVFTVDSVYEFYNKNFINYKSDMEKGEGIDLKNKYEVKSFPTYLFVNAEGELVHRASSLMPVKEFIKEAETALNPTDSYVAWKKRYDGGERSNDLLFKYGNAVRNVNGAESDKIKLELSKQITNTELLSDFGWEVIKGNSRSEEDRLGSFLFANRKFYENLAGEKAVQTVVNRLKMNAMYGLLREKNSKEFFLRLEQMRKDIDPVTQRNVVMLEADYYLENNIVDSFIAITEKARMGIFEMNDADLSFIARRASYKGQNNAAALQQALILARQAVKINPEEYSNQGTLASICLALKLKEEGLVAARKARALAEEFTSKIQKIAQTQIDSLEAL